MDRFRYSRSDQFVYQIVIPIKPLSAQAKRNSLQEYKTHIRHIAEKYIDSPISEDDIEIEITWASVDHIGIRSDLDNIVKPIVDSLIGVAYHDDNQIRTVVATFFDRKMKNTICCYVEDLAHILYTGNDNVIQVTIYSDSKLKEKGGAETMREYFLRKKLPGIIK